MVADEAAPDEPYSAGGWIVPGPTALELDVDECVLDTTTWRCARGGAHEPLCVDRLLEESEG